MPIPAGQDEIRACIITSLAEVRATDVEDIESEIALGDGDLEIDSKQGTTVIAMLEGAWECELPGPEDLAPEQYTSVSALTTLIHRKRNSS